MKSLQIIKAKHILHNCNVTKFIKSRPLSSEVLLENTDNTNYAKYQPIFGKYIKELLLPENYSCQDRPPDDVSSTNGFLFNSSLTVYKTRLVSLVFNHHGILVFIFEGQSADKAIFRHDPRNWREFCSAPGKFSFKKHTIDCSQM